VDKNSVSAASYKLAWVNRQQFNDYNHALMISLSAGFEIRYLTLALPTVFYPAVYRVVKNDTKSFTAAKR